MSKVTWLTLLFLAAAVGSQANDAIEIEYHGVAKTFSVAELKKLIKVHTVTIDDEVYKKTKTYDGFALRDLVQLAGPQTVPVDEVAFRAADGYTPTTPLATLDGETGIVAFQEHGRADKWEKIEQGKTWLSPAPFYLVWEHPHAKELPAPYQLVKISLVSFAEKFAKIFPASAPKNSAAMRGFTVFRQVCFSCHSINLSGGDLAPELNVPKNVTEYWSAKNLHAFIKNASSFRLKTKMPPFTSYDDAKIDDVVAYLEYMKGHKEFPKP